MDGSTTQVTNWLNHFGAAYFRVDKEDVYKIRNIIISNNNFEFQVQFSDRPVLNLNEIRAVWHRRGWLSLDMLSLDNWANSDLIRDTKRHLLQEKNVLVDFFDFILKEKPHIGRGKLGQINKLIVLQKAAALGLSIPFTQITTKSKNIQVEENIITKSISENYNVSTDGVDYTSYTESIDKKDLKSDFFPTLFQVKEHKEADIRTFYLCGKFYSMAILSQKNKQTEVDFRKYLRAEQGLTRYVPFKLPTIIEDKVRLLMADLELETGSIDFILNSKGDFTFLEINPVGQFAMTSYPCNYNIERDIAKKLINLSTI